MRSAVTELQNTIEHKRTTRNGVGNCSSKTGSRRQSEKKTILKHFLKGFLEGKSLPWVSETSKFTNHKIYLNLAIYKKIYLNFPIVNVNLLRK